MRTAARYAYRVKTDVILVLGGDPTGGGLANWLIRMAALNVIDDALDEAARKAESESK